MGGVAGGYDEAPLLELVQAAKGAGVKEVYVEKNFGHGAHMSVLKPLFEREYPCDIVDDYSSGQKEARIIDSLEPLMSAHRLVVNRDLIDKDVQSTKGYPAEVRKTYQLFSQMSHMTYAKNCVKHDDRVEALASACRVLVGSIDYDYTSKLSKEKHREALEMQEIMRDPKKRRNYLGVEGGRISTKMNQFARKTGRSKRRW